MANVQKQFKTKLMSALSAVMWDLGQKALLEAKNTAPVKTGTLKASGTISRVVGSNQYKWSCKIVFSAPYASLIEEGRDAGVYDKSPYVYNIRAHKRKIPNKVSVGAYSRGSGGVTAHKRGGQIDIKAHTATHIGTRRVPVKGGGQSGVGYITTARIPAIKATHFIQNAVQKVLSTEIGNSMKLMPRQLKIRI